MSDDTDSNVISLDWERRKRRNTAPKTKDQKINEAIKKHGHLTGNKERVCEKCNKINMKPFVAFICDHCGHRNEK